MAALPSIPGTVEAWETGALGREEEFVRVSPDDDENGINAALDLQPISIRLERSLIEEFKQIAQINGLGYQPLMRQALRRFAECEMKRIVRDLAADKASQRAAQQDQKAPPASAKSKKVA